MKIVSWNVNGLAACVRKGFFKFISHMNADVVCLQETRSEFPLNLPNYPYQLWNAARRKGYSGTLLLSRSAPLSWSSGIGIKKFDDEGRLITAEFKDFYIVNAYTPNVNTASKPGREEYRVEWDEALRCYLDKLGKPVIVCGDLNVAHRHIDVYPENQKNALPPPMFNTEERAGFEKLLSLGLTDAYRHLYPYQTGAYTWWGPKNANRGINHGSRLDYFLVSDELLQSIREVEHHVGVYGSDHCPISLRIVRAGASYLAPPEELGAQWRLTDWVDAERELRELQKALSQAAYGRDWRAVRDLQQEIARSPAAKVLAVRAVADAGSAAGIDGVRLRTDAQKMQVVRSMVSKGYIPRPARIVEIRDKRKIRMAEISVARDKAMMTLYKYLLDPVAEAVMDKRVFSARKGRSTLDALAYLCRALSAPDAPVWVVRFDVEAYYYKIVHRELLGCVPMDRSMTKKFLDSGYVKNGELFSKDQGISISSPLSPIFGNLLLNGLQGFVYDHLYPKGDVDYPNGSVFRFADDGIILARTRRDATNILNIVKDFLEIRGLSVNHEKTKIVHVEEGFDFLSWRIQKRNGVLKTWPAPGSVLEITGELQKLIFEFNGTQRELIGKINQKLSGWASYHRVTDAYDAFQHIDTTVEALLLERMELRYPRWTRAAIRREYWTLEDKHPTFALPRDHTVRVLRLAALGQVEHEPVALRYNPYLDPDYYHALKSRREQQKAVGKYKAVWQRQGGKCAVCGGALLFDQEFEVVEKELGKGRGVQNLLYIHSFCSYNILSEEEQLRGAGVNTIELLEDIADTAPERESPYYELTQYFHSRNEQIVTLTFAQIEKITGIELDFDAHLFDAFWYDDTPGRDAPMWKEEGYPAHAIDAQPRDYCICHSWLSQGYQIKLLERGRERIVFRKVIQNMSGVVIPPELYTMKFPDKRAAEISKYLEKAVKEYYVGRRGGRAKQKTPPAVSDETAGRGSKREIWASSGRP